MLADAHQHLWTGSSSARSSSAASSRSSGGRVDLHDPSTFYDTSSYDPAAIDATAALVGERQLVYGSDRPVIGAAITERDRRLQVNSATLLQGAKRAQKEYV